MKLSISNIAWTEHEDHKMYEYLSEKGFSGLEIAPTRIFGNDPYKKIDLAIQFSKNIKSEYNLEISSLQSILFGKTEKLFGSQEERNYLLNYTKMAIDFAQSINCRNLVFGSPKNRIIEDITQVSEAVIFFKELGEYSLKKQTILSIEANPTIYGTNFINTTTEAFELVKKVDSDGFMVNVDLGTVIQNKESVKNIIKNINLVNHIHVSEPYLNPIEIRELHRDLARELKTTNYNRYVSIEMKNTNDIGITKKVIDYIKEVFDDS